MKNGSHRRGREGMGMDDIGRTGCGKEWHKIGRMIAVGVRQGEK